MNQESAAIEAVRRAARLCRAVQAELVDDDTMTKGDRSPVTVADFGAQAVIALTLRSHGDALPIVGEESADALRGAGAASLRQQVVHHVGKASGRPVATEEVLDAIDDCADGGGSTGRRWVLDPIDGTKGYLRRQQYAIALGLLDEGRPTFGVLGCPELHDGDGGRGCLLVGSVGNGARQLSLDDDSERPITVTDLDDPTDAAFCESVETAHSAHERHAAIAAVLGVEAPPVRIDSQCKYACLARGDASIYLRLPRSESYEEKIWDHAAGFAVLTAAGGEATDAAGKPLDFSLGRTLSRNRGIVATNGRLHRLVIDAVLATET